MDRRTFILATAALAAGCSRSAETGTAVSAEATATAAAAPLGVQLYTLRDLMAESVASALELVASSGYREVEFAGYFDHTPKQLRALLDANGLSAPSGHISNQLFAAEPEKMADVAAAMGHKYLVIPWTDEHERSIDDYHRHAESFNRWGEICKAAGLQFAYHNHDFEFHETDGILPYDLLLEETDPSVVAFELDLAWAQKGNADSVGYFNKWPGRFPLLHVKDMNAEGNEVDIGDGDVDFAAIFAAAETGGVKHGFVERDNPVDAAISIKNNFDAISPIWTAAHENN